MIDGFPHQPADSFFHYAVTRLQQETAQSITTSMFTMGGFPIPRVLRHVESKCVAFKPDIVVLQFGATDLVVPLRRKKNRDGTTAAAFHGRSSTPASMMSGIRWQIQGWAGDLLQLEPVTPVGAYLETKAQIIRTLLAKNITPVVVSPFVFGGRRSDRNARHCTARLQDLLATLPKAFFVDAYGALDRHPRQRMLLADGGHLSLAGQQVVGEELLIVLRRIISR